MSPIKRALSGILAGCARTSAGRVVYRQIIQGAMGRTRTVTCRGEELIFSPPNWLSQYRADTFATKEPDTLEWLDAIPADAVFWDVGANVGLYSVFAAKTRRCTVFAFEPSVFNLELLARNIWNNRLNDDITIVPVALGDALSVNTFEMSSTEWGGALSTFGAGIDQHGAALHGIFKYRTIGVSMDEAVDRLGVPPPRALKIDVDGIEHFILRGGSRVLSRVDSVLVEINDAFVEQAEECARHLSNAGLSLHRKCDLNAAPSYNQWWTRP